MTPEWDAPTAEKIMESGSKDSDVDPGWSEEARWNGNRGVEWINRCNNLISPCSWDKEYLKNGVPRIKANGHNFLAKPRFLAIKAYRQTLIKLFPEPFTKNKDPVSIVVFCLCGYSNCVNLNHLPIIFRQHKAGLNTFRIETDGNDGWWSGAEHFYASYKAYLFEDAAAQNAREGTRKHQRRIQAKLARRKRKYTEGERARAITMLSDGSITYEMYKEMKAIFLGLSEDIFDQTMIIYATRARDIREGKIQPGYLPDARKNPFKGFKTEKKKNERY